MLRAVTIKYEHPSGDLHMLDGSSLRTHLWIISAVLALDGVSCTEKQLMLSVRCVAKMILHTTPRLTEVSQGAVLAWIGSFLGTCTATRVVVHCSAERIQV